MTGMRHLFVAMLAILAFSLHAAEWESYPFTDSYRNVCRMGDKIYLLKGNTLARADLGQWEVETPLTREDGLSGNNIYDILYSETAKRLVIVYDDALIDVIHPDGSIWTITDLYTAPMEGWSKEIKGMREQEGRLYLSTAFGFVIIDLYNEALLHTIHLGKSVYCAWAYSGDWYYSTDEGTYYCSQSNNPYNPNAWSFSSNHVIQQALVIGKGKDSQCWLVSKDQSLRKIVAPSHVSIRCTNSKTVKGVLPIGKYVLVHGTDSLSLYDTTFGTCPTVDQTPLPGQRLVCPSTTQLGASNRCLLQSDSLQLAFVFPSAGIEADSLCIGADSFTIRSLHSKRLQLTNRQQSNMINRLVYDGQGEVGMSYVSATVNGYNYQMSTSGFLTTVRTSTGKWNNYDATIVSSKVTDGNARFVGLLDFIADPLHPQRYWFSTLEDGIVEIEKGKFQRRYNKYNTNAGIDNYASGCTRVAGLAISPQGDLWCINDGVKEILRVHRDSTDTWHSFQLTGLEKSYGFTHLIHTRQGGRHQLWACQEFKYNSSAIFCYDYGDDITDRSDDRFATFRTFEPIDEASFVPYYGRGIYEGPDGTIWILNTSGLFAIDQPDSIFSHPGRVRTVLSDVIPTAIVADNQQHLWVSTQQHGLFLLSTDGREELAHLTTDNSQLTSNEVLSLAFDASQSTLWIAIQGQLLSYSYDESEYGAAADWTSTAWCHPGSVAVGSHPTIQVFGVTSDTEVTVQNSQGRIVARAYAWGDHATLDANGLPIGTYYIYGTDSEGHQGHISTFEVQ